MTATLPDATSTDSTQVNPAADSEVNTPQVYATKPMTGDEYIESIADDREIWLHGERVKDHTNHPAFRNSVRMIARLYDSMHSGEPVSYTHLTLPTKRIV